MNIQLVKLQPLTIDTALKQEQLETPHNSTGNISQDDDIFTHNEASDARKLQLQTLTNRKGKCPDTKLGLTHELMKLAWEKGNIETIFETANEDLIYTFYQKCVSRTVGKRNWNECSQVNKLHEYVSASDEAFAMLVLENNLPKWMDELRFEDQLTVKERRNTLYTEGKEGRKWTTKGIVRYVELHMICEQYRNGNYDKISKYRRIEEMIIRREILWNENSTRKRRKVNHDTINNSEIDNNSEEQDMTEQYLLALINGEETSTTVTE